MGLLSVFVGTGCDLVWGWLVVQGFWFYWYRCGFAVWILVGLLVKTGSFLGCGGGGLFVR